MKVGICLGSSSVSVYSDADSPLWIQHNGDPISVLRQILKDFPDPIQIAFTGRKLRRYFNAPSISESEACEIAYSHLKEKYHQHQAIVSAGGENFVLYKLDRDGRINGVYTGNKCASGTGEFFLQQLRRMGIDLSQISQFSYNGIYKLSSRCTVFCKSDCTHALNKGVPKEMVLNGLGKVMADKILQLAHSARVNKILLIGGTTKNQLMLRNLEGQIEFTIPQEATYFEALGAYLWIDVHRTWVVNKSSVLSEKLPSAFSRHKPLLNFSSMVEFKQMERGTARSGDECVLGVDVGSTTTKAVLVRISDKKILASSYLRTLGDPVNASRKCYTEILEQIKVPVRIIAVGVTGSGRKIVGLHVGTSAVYNEIMAHARAAAFFDPEVDTIFEIGGQDAKYTYLNEGIPYDYAMNEACSAGTGSFLEEAARESLGIDYTQIADYALKGQNPPNFSDQCAAFINSDIKTAIQEQIDAEDICAGLVYSICMNYINRVKGNRPVGKKLFVQGGTCYNRAIPYAMAALTGKKVIVPPEPGLMGAYGVALMTMENLDKGVLQKSTYDLKELADRQVKYLKPFVCSGGKNKCDRKCTISVIEIDNKRLFFGGSCNMYENIRENRQNTEDFDFLRLRERLLYKLPQPNARGKRIGLSRSFAMNSLFPFFSKFFSELGFEVVLPDEPDEQGKDRMGAEFCFPVEQSHGFLISLLKKNPDYIFIPRIKAIRVSNSDTNGVFCPFVQSEADWLKADIPELTNFNLLTCNIDFTEPNEKIIESLDQMLKPIGIQTADVRRAFYCARQAQEDFERNLKQIGKDFLDKVEKTGIGIVIFGRSYNAFLSYANLGVPRKISSYGYPVVSFDALPFADNPGYENMYWAWGEMIIRAANYVKNHPKLFPVYITNFSCGPDSFLLSYFKDVMKDKPALILELDSHTADAGIETRIEAFFDVIRYRKKKQYEDQIYKPLSVQINKSGIFISKDSELITWTDKRVRLVFPTMGAFGASCLAAAIEHFGVNTFVCPPMGEIDYKLGRGNSLSKECLPLQLTLGSLIRYLSEYRSKDEITLYFMPQTSGPCRFGQYNVYMKLWLRQNKIKDTAILSLSSENAYGGLGIAFTLRAWIAILISDIYSNIEKSLMAVHTDKQLARNMVQKHQEMIINSLKHDSLKDIFNTLEQISQELASLNLSSAYSKLPKVLLTGEIYVRWDEFSRKRIEELLASEQIILQISPIHEWMYYTDYIFLKKLTSKNSTYIQRAKKKIEVLVKRYFEKKVKKIFAKAGLCDTRMLNVKHVVEHASAHLDPVLTGEAILTIGSTLAEIGEYYDGVISIGPFGCMPSRIAEAIIKSELERRKTKTSKRLPFVSLEVDGNPFTPSVEAKIDSFMVQVKTSKGRI
ncbi:MAG TPA: acyl-CoA dehydratase activase [Pseudothermotoga sp.]|nr:acyl-CoA dehydratase activase [Pseudothermotoga sp.]HPP69111.1 acyl-CoA dehydratase activase [Pseudothermotoga sp.]